MLAFFAGSVAIIVTTLIANYFIMAWTEPDSSSLESVTVVGVSDVGGGPKLITPVSVFTGVVQNVYTTFDASSFIPAGTEVVLLEAECGINLPDEGTVADIDAHIKIRKNNTSQSYLLLRGRSAATDDNVAFANQGSFPVELNGTFQYIVESPGFSEGCEVNLVGYY